jgi:precorrin-6B methylase 2
MSQIELGRSFRQLTRRVVEMMLPSRTLDALVRARVLELTELIKRSTNMLVQNGPFRGMELPVETPWSDLASKLLGDYEMELSPLIDSIISENPDIIVNIGCAEGYYAIGMAISCPSTLVYAFDTDPFAQKICLKAAKTNGVDARVQVGGLCTADCLSDLITSAERPFLFMDCEGGELDLLRSVDRGAFSRTILLVECHDFIYPETTARLIELFENTHSIFKIEQGPRNPHMHPILRPWSENEKWLVLSEARPETMHWLVMVPMPTRLANAGPAAMMLSGSVVQVVQKV